VRPRPLALIVALALLLAACANDGDDEGGSPSGSLGPVAQEAADEAILGLCTVIDAVDARSANAEFQNRSHQTLHEIAAAAEVVDRDAAATLLEAKQRVEADLSRARLPENFAGDVETLLEATHGALEAIGLEVAPCEV
jgi:hypothetical protein